jgi:hypothetical protein
LERQAVKIVSRDKANFAKNKTSFRRLTEKVRKLEETIKNDEIKGHKLIQIYDDLLFPQKFKLAEITLQLILELVESSNRIQLSNRLKIELSSLILDLFEVVFEYLEVTQEIENVFEEWSDITYQEYFRLKLKKEKQNLSYYVDSLFSKSVHNEDENHFSDFQSKIKEGFLGSDSSKKSKRQKDKAERQQIEELIQTKTIRSIYISLTKTLHPDTELDEELKKEKEELMKMVTSAYEAKDLETLLRLEMEWVITTNQQIDGLSIDKLNHYLVVLKERILELEQTKRSQLNDPRFKEIATYLEYEEEQAIDLIHEEEKLIQIESNELNLMILKLGKIRNQKELEEIMNSYQENFKAHSKFQ